MGGSSDCAFDLARYNFEYWGWYPCQGRPPSKDPQSGLGFEWLELSAQSSMSDAKAMYQRYLILSLILRENGLRQEGHDAIRRGLLDIEQYSGDLAWRGWALKQLQMHDRGWNSIKISVQDLLGDDAKPQLLADQRRQTR
jgi:thiamine kinase-like enzyme